MSNMPEPLTWMAEQFILLVTILLSILGSAHVVLRQIAKQHDSSLKLQRQNKVDELRLEIYKGLSEIIQTGESAYASLSSIPNRIVQTLVSNSKQSTEKNTPIVIRSVTETPDILASKFDEANMIISSILSKIEQYEIALPNFAFIRIRIVEKSGEVSSAYVHFLTKVYLFLNEQPLEKTIPNPDKLAEIDKFGNEYSDKLRELMCFMHDLRIEAQNNLLSSLFDDRKLEHRKPLDPKWEVLRAKEIDVNAYLESKLKDIQANLAAKSNENEKE